MSKWGIDLKPIIHQPSCKQLAPTRDIVIQCFDVCKWWSVRLCARSPWHTAQRRNMLFLPWKQSLDLYPRLKCYIFITVFRMQSIPKLFCVARSWCQQINTRPPINSNHLLVSINSIYQSNITGTSMEICGTQLHSPWALEIVSEADHYSLKFFHQSNGIAADPFARKLYSGLFVVYGKLVSAWHVLSSIQNEQSYP